MAGNPLTDPTWASDVTDTIERLVGKVRDNVTVKAVTVVRALVFGIIIAIAAIATLVLVIILATKLLEGLVRFPTRADHASSVWISYLVMSGVLFLAGAFCMRKRFETEDGDK
jgi:H+/Cl- antiporter ClcA